MDRVLIFDIETDQPFSLKKYDSWRFAEECKVTCISYCGEDGVVESTPSPRDFFENVACNYNVWVCHNASFDVSVAMHQKGFCGLPDKIVCTKAMCNLVGIPASLNDASEYLGFGKKLDIDITSEYSFEECREYCEQDVNLTLKVYQKLKPMIKEKEFDNIDGTMRMNLRGIKVDKNKIREIKEEQSNIVDTAKKEFRNITGFDATQVKVFTEYLHKEGYAVTGVGKDELKKLLKRKKLDEKIKKLCELRLQVAQNEVKKFEKMLDVAGADSRIHNTFHHSLAITGRWSSKVVNLQNCKRDGDVRKVFIPEDEHTFYIADYKTIELKILLWYCDEFEVLKESVKSDLYMKLARQVYGKDATRNHRNVCKIAILAMQYNISIPSLMETFEREGFELSFDETAKIYNIVHNQIPKLRDMWDRLFLAYHSVLMNPNVYKKGEKMRNINGAKLYMDGKMLVMRLPTGRNIYYHNASILGDKRIKYFRENKPRFLNHCGTTMEHCCSGSARDIIASAIARFTREGFRVVSTIHDEVIVEIPKEKATPEFKDYLDKLMIPDNLPEDLPIQVESNFSDSWVKG